MKKKSILVLPLLATSAMLAACNNIAGGGSGGGQSSGGQGDDGKITVNFYIDFNAGTANKEYTIGGKNSLEVYASQRVKNGEKVTKPADPTTSPFPEFPVFIGWSAKEVVDSKADLWNFDSDTVNSDINTFSIYGIWVSEGEN